MAASSTIVPGSPELPWWAHAQARATAAGRHRLVMRLAVVNALVLAVALIGGVIVQVRAPEPSVAAFEAAAGAVRRIATSGVVRIERQVRFVHKDRTRRVATTVVADPATGDARVTIGRDREVLIAGASVYVSVPPAARPSTSGRPWVGFARPADASALVVVLQEAVLPAHYVWWLAVERREALRVGDGRFRYRRNLSADRITLDGLALTGTAETVDVVLDGDRVRELRTAARYDGFVPAEVATTSRFAYGGALEIAVPPAADVEPVAGADAARELLDKAAAPS